MKKTIAIIVCIALLATTFGITWREAYGGIESIVDTTSEAIEKISSVFLPNAFKESWNNVEQGEVNGIDVRLYIKNKFHLNYDKFEIADNVYKVEGGYSRDNLYYVKVERIIITETVIKNIEQRVYTYYCLNGTLSGDGATYIGLRTGLFFTSYVGYSTMKTKIHKVTAYEQNITVGDYLRGLNNE